MEPEIEVMPKRRVPWVALLVIGFLLFVSVSILGPIFASARVAAKKTLILSNFRKLHVAWVEYAADYDDRACMLHNWNATLIGHKGSELRQENLVNPSFGCGVWSDCTNDRTFGLNGVLSGFSLRTDAEADRVPVFAQTTKGGQDASASRTLLPEDRCVLVLLDGHVKFMPTPSAQLLQWEPTGLKNREPRPR